MASFGFIFVTYWIRTNEIETGDPIILEEASTLDIQFNMISLGFNWDLFWCLHGVI